MLKNRLTLIWLISVVIFSYLATFLLCGVKINPFFLTTVIITFFFLFLYFLNKKIKNEAQHLLHSLGEIDYHGYSLKAFNEIADLFTNLDSDIPQKKDIVITRSHYLAQSKDDIISAISHEFKNPIAIISGYAQTLLGSELDKETERKFLKKIEMNAMKLSELIDRLYLLTKLEHHKVEMQKEEHNIYEIVKKYVESLDNTRVIVLGKSRNVLCDKRLIEVVISNLVMNSLKYSDEDVVVKIDEKIKIMDQGIGIEENHLTQIKEKFFRVHQHHWDNSLGLGLSIVERILSLHESKLEIESEKGKGSCFCFKI